MSSGFVPIAPVSSPGRIQKVACGTVPGFVVNAARISVLANDYLVGRGFSLWSLRRHYEGEESPLASTLALYNEFFSLFGDFEHYVEFFLLQDLVSASGSVNYFLPFDNFVTPTLPGTAEECQSYRAKVTRFVAARNDRINALFG